jgi:hypothetical protein
MLLGAFMASFDRWSQLCVFSSHFAAPVATMLAERRVYGFADALLFLDIVDYHEPQMLIVGSRGLGQLKGILLGSTSHYLIEVRGVSLPFSPRRAKNRE